jgi:aminoglycoside phosphotransferase (APT) family kinase protein
MPGDFEHKLQAVLSREIPGFKALLSCTQLTAGASQETYRITVATDSGKLLLALRRSQPTSTAESGVGGISLAAEAKLFQVAGARPASAAYPAARRRAGRGLHDGVA